MSPSAGENTRWTVFRETWHRGEDISPTQHASRCVGRCDGGLSRSHWEKNHAEQTPKRSNRLAIRGEPHEMPLNSHWMRHDSRRINGSDGAQGPIPHAATVLLRSNLRVDHQLRRVFRATMAEFSRSDESENSWDRWRCGGD